MWIEAIVMSREEPEPYRPAPQRNRTAAYQSACAENAQLRDHVLNFLESHGMRSAVKWISEPGSLPMVSLHCTPQALELLRQAPHFEAGGGMSLERYT